MVVFKILVLMTVLKTAVYVLQSGFLPHAI